MKEKINNYLKEKHVGFYLALATAVSALIAAFIYVITINPSSNYYITESDYQPLVFWLMLLAAVIGLLLIAVPFVLELFVDINEQWYRDFMRGMTAFAPWAMFIFVIIAFSQLVYSGYTIFLSLAPGREGLEPIFIANLHIPLIFYTLAMLFSVVSVSVPIINKKKIAD